MALLDNALAVAIAKRDPQILVAAVERDARIGVEADSLDGVATWMQGPLADSHAYPAKDGRIVILYRRDGDEVVIERVKSTRSNWKDEAP